MMDNFVLSEIIRHKILFSEMMAKVIFIAIIVLLLQKHMTRGLCAIKGRSNCQEIECQKLSSDLLTMELNNILESSCNPIRKLTIYDSYISNTTFQNDKLSYVEKLSMINSNLPQFQNDTFNYLYNLKDFFLSNSNLLFIDAHVLPFRINVLNLTSSNIQKVFNFNQYSIILSYSNISVIERDSFSTSQSINSLILDHSKINRIHEEAFSNLRYLANLDLNHNNLTNLNFRFDSEMECILNISHNKITNLKIKNVHKFLSNVVQLDLSYNKINKINNNINSTDLFISSKLSNLYLNNNNISVIKNFYFQSFKHLVLLNLSSNPIHLIEPYALMSLKLNTVYIKKSIQTLDQNIFNTWCVHKRTLDLSDSNITNIKDYSFINCTDLEFLNLQNNRIKILRKNVFNGLFSLKVLNLNNNKIADIELGAFNISSSYNHLQKLYLSDISTLEPTIFIGLRLLKFLFLTKSVIPQLTEGSFRFLPTLEELNLQYNTFGSLEKRAFIGLPFLHTLNLSHSSFDTLKIGVFNDCGSVKILDLTNIKLPPAFKLDFEGLNNLKTLFLRNVSFNFGSPIDLCVLKELRHLHLQKNNFSDLGHFYLPCLLQLTFLSVANNNIFNLDSNTFKKLKELKVLNLANNKIDSLPFGLFQDLITLEELHLENNKIMDLGAGIFSPLKSLNYLNISHNMMTILSDLTFTNMINLKYLDIRFNKFAFIEPKIDFIMHMPSLLYIGISDNDWSCSALVTQLNFLQSKNIAYQITSNLENGQYGGSNIDGIYCDATTWLG